MLYHISYVNPLKGLITGVQDGGTKTQILLHIRSMNFRSKFVEISDHVSKPKFYHIENLILPHYESLPGFDPKKCGKIWFSMW